VGKAWGFAWATVAFLWGKQHVNPGFYTTSPLMRGDVTQFEKGVTDDQQEPVQL